MATSSTTAKSVGATTAPRMMATTAKNLTPGESARTMPAKPNCLYAANAGNVGAKASMDQNT